MRKPLILAVLLLSSTSLLAADNWRASVLASEISSGGNSPWSDDVSAGLGIAIAYAPTPNWDAELTVASQSYISPYTRFFLVNVGDGLTMPIMVTEYHRYRVMPIDVSVTRHFRPDQAIVPYVRAGLRYVDAPGRPRQQATGFFIPNGPAMPVPEPVGEGYGYGYGFRDRVSAQAGAGFRVRMTPRTALRVEATRLLRDEKVDFDPLTRFAAGVSWAF